MFKVLTEGCEPTKGSKYSACVDLYASEDVVIGAGETKLVGLGVAIDYNLIMRNYCDRLGFDIGLIDFNEYPLNPITYRFNHFLRSHYLQLEPRSSLRVKGLQAGTGIIDLDYEDEIKMIIHNPLKFDQVRIASLLINEKIDVQQAEYICTSENIQIDYEIKKGDKIAQIMLCEHKSYLFGIETENERTGGFGSTGDSK